MNEDRIEYVVICTSHYAGPGGWMNATRARASGFCDAARERVEEIQEAVPDALEFVVVRPDTVPVFARRVRVTKAAPSTFYAEII